MQDPIYKQSENQQELSAKKRRGKITLAAGIAGTFAVGALLGAQFAAEDSSYSVFNWQSSSEGVQLYCTPINQGELRTYQNRWCASIDGTTKYPGIGSLKTGYCNGTGDQIYSQCTDGTFRNVAENSCLSASGSKASFATCGNGNSMQWSVDTGSDWSSNGVDQSLFTVKNEGGQCLVINGNKSGSGTFGMGSCGSSDAKVYYENYGTMLASGNMVNLDNHQCVLTNTRNNMSENTPLLVNNSSCSSANNEIWAYYENGWVVSSQTNWCLETEENSGGGAMATYPCTGNSNQIWESQMYSGTTYVLKNQASGKCFQFSGAGNPQIAKCDNGPQQQFNFETPGSGSWNTPTGYWGNNKCSESGSVSLQLTQSVTASHGVTDTTTVSVAIQESLLWGTVKTTQTVSNSVATQYSTTVTSSSAYTFNCQYYADTMEPFTTGCIWQGYVNTTSATDSGSSVLFSTSYVACTPSASPPSCPPMETCSDSSCTSCVNMS